MRTDNLLALLLVVATGIVGLILGEQIATLVKPFTYSMVIPSRIGFAAVGAIYGAIFFRFAPNFYFALIPTVPAALLLAAALRVIFISAIQDRSVDLSLWFSIVRSTGFGFSLLLVAPLTSFFVFMLLRLHSKHQESLPPITALKEIILNHRMLIALIIIVGSMSIAYTVLRDSDLIAEAKTNVKNQLKDPDSVKFQGVQEYFPKIVCGELNAKNSLGGYVGYRNFIYYGATGRIEFTPSENDISIHCNTRRGELDMKLKSVFGD